MSAAPVNAAPEPPEIATCPAVAVSTLQVELRVQVAPLTVVAPEPGRSPVPIAVELNTPATAVACKTCVVVVSEFAPTMYSLVIGNVSVTAPDDAGKVRVVKFVEVPVTSWLLVVPRYRGWLNVALFAAKVNFGLPLSALPSDPPAATARLPLPSSVEVVEGVCSVVVPPPVTKAVLVSEPELTTVTVPEPPGVEHVPSLLR